MWSWRPVKHVSGHGRYLGTLPLFSSALVLSSEQVVRTEYWTRMLSLIGFFEISSWSMGLPA